MYQKLICGNTTVAQPHTQNRITYDLKFIFRQLALLGLLFIPLSAYTQDEPEYAPFFSYSSHFRYYTPSDNTMPAGSENVSKGITAITSLNQLNRSNDENESATAFIIQTFRDDDTVCICTAGHVAKAIFNHNLPYLSGPPYNVYPFNMYLNYLGRPDPDDATVNEVISGYRSPLPVNARLVRYLQNPDPASVEDPDLALFLVDSKQLPAVANYAQIGYDLTGLYGKAPNTIGRFYQIGHPYGMPQRITTDAGFTPGTAQKPNVIYSGPLAIPHGISLSSSGSPWVIKTLADGTAANTGTAVAVHSATIYKLMQPIFSDPFWGNMQYGDDSKSTELAAIAAEIKAYCWKNKTAAQLEQTKEYRRTLVIDNSSNLQPFTVARILFQLPDLTGIDSPSAYTVTENSGGTSVSATYLKASTCTIGSPVFPANHASTGKPWQINIMAKEINITPATASAFDYTATGSAAFNIGAALVETTVQTINTSNTELPLTTYNNNTNTQTRADLAIWPNPSSTGRFQIAVPAGKTNESYLVVIHDAASGRKIAEGSIAPGTTYPLDISSYAKGVYIASFYQNSKLLHTAKLVYW